MTLFEWNEEIIKNEDLLLKRHFLRWFIDTTSQINEFIIVFPYFPCFIYIFVLM
jgi:hypothetical protein